MSPAWRLRIEVVIVLGCRSAPPRCTRSYRSSAKLTEERALGDQSVALNPSRSSREWLDFTYQFLDVFFGLFAVALVLYLLWQPGRSPFRRIGLDFTRPGRDAASGLLLVAVIGVPGLALYAIGRALGLTVAVQTSPADWFWWTVPILVFRALEAALTEEVIVVGYLFTRFAELGVGRWATILSSAVLRGQLPPVPGLRAVLRQRRDGHRVRLVLRAMGPHDAARHRALDHRHRVVRRLPAGRRLVAGALRRSGLSPDGRRRRMPRARRLRHVLAARRARRPSQASAAATPRAARRGGRSRWNGCAPCRGRCADSACRRPRTPRRRTCRRLGKSLMNCARRSAAAVPGSRRSSSDARFSRPKPLPASRLLPTKTPANATVPSTAMRSTGIMRNPLFERTSVYSRAPSSGLPGCRDIPPRRAWCRRGRSMLRGWGTRP